MAGFDRIAEREAGLRRELTAGQLSMIAIGGAIGTGLFLGSKFAIGMAGPSVIVSYAIGGAIALLLMAALAEMTVHHSTSGSFGAYAEHYVGPLAGYVVRYMYWSCIVLAVGAEVTAIGEYMRLWLPAVPGWIWVVAFSGALVVANARNVATFGTLEYWFSAIKVAAIVAFIAVSAAVLVGGRAPAGGLANFTAAGGFWYGGLSGMWFAVIVSIFSYLSIEMIAVAAGEADDPQRAVSTAFRSTVARLIVFYLATLTLVIATTPVARILDGGSPFVTSMQALGIDAAGHVLNFVVIVASLSAMNSQLYVSTRMMFSLARAGDAPRIFGTLGAAGAPLWALALSCFGILAAVIVKAVVGDDAVTTMMAISMFGAMVTWLMIFVTHWHFRAHVQRAEVTLAYRTPVPAAASLVGAAAMLAILATTPFAPGFAATLIYGLPALGVTVAAYYLTRGRAAAAPSGVRA